MESRELSTSSRNIRPRHLDSNSNHALCEDGISVLYRDALACVLAFASLSDIHAVACVCKKWKHAALAIPSLGLMHSIIIEKDRAKLFVTMCYSDLRRHIKDLWILGSLTCEQLAMLWYAMPHLSVFSCTINCGVTAMRFAPNVGELNVRFGKDTNTETLNRVIEAIARLRLVHTLQLSFEECPIEATEGMLLAPLAHVASLTDLEIQCLKETNKRHIEELRTVTQLRRISVDLSRIDLDTLFATGHNFRHLDMLSVHLNWNLCDETWGTLAQFSRITDLELHSIGQRHADIIVRLPCLTSLMLDFRAEEDDIEFDPVMKALQQCVQMKKLHLWGADVGFTSDQLAVALQRMPFLATLWLNECKRLDSLSFLAAGTITSTLTELKMGMGTKKILQADVVRLDSLKSLKCLELGTTLFCEPVSETCRQRYTPPSRVLPSLENFQLVSEIYWEDHLRIAAYNDRREKRKERNR